MKNKNLEKELERLRLENKSLSDTVNYRDEELNEVKTQNNELREDINKLLMIKKNSNEKKYVDHISSLDEFIFTSLEEKDVSFMEDREVSWGRLNNVFRLIIDAYHNSV
mgnify:FL=1